MATILTEDFNSYNDGNLEGQGGWTLRDGTSGQIYIQGTTVKEGAKAADGQGTLDCNDGKTGSQLSDGRITYYARMGTADKQGCGFYLREGGSTRIQVTFRAGGYIDYYDGSAWHHLKAWAADTWYCVEIEWRSSDKKARYRVDGGTWTDWDTTQTAWTNYLDTVVICSTGADPVVHQYWDHIAENPLPTLQTILPSAIASLEAFGTARLNLKLFPSAIASLEAFGSPTVILVGNYIYPTGIASLEAFGNPTVLPGAVILQPSAIQSAEALGSPQLNLKLFAQGIPSAETFGTPLVIPGAVIIQPSGIASLEAFGTPLVFYDQVIIPTGIASAEAFGTPTISFILLIKPKSIPSAEAFGTLKVLREIIHIILDGQYTQGSPGVNRVYIIGKDAEGNPVYGTSLNQAEIDLVGERLDFTQDLSIPTTAKAADVAAAAVAKARLTGARGFIVIPPNCGQELWDVIQVTDKPTAQSQQKYRVIAVSFDYEPRRARCQHKLILGAP